MVSKNDRFTIFMLATFFQSSSAASRAEVEEREHFRKVVLAFKSYERDSKTRLERTWGFLRRMSEGQREALKKRGYQACLEEVEKCVKANANLIREMTADVGHMFENRSEDLDEDEEEDGLVVVSELALLAIFCYLVCLSVSAAKGGYEDKSDAQEDKPKRRG